MRSVAPVSILLVFLSGPAGCAARKEPLHEFQFLAFGTLIELTLWGVDRDLAERAYQAVESDFARMHTEWHPWQPGALVETNRQLAAGKPFLVPHSMIPLIENSQRLSLASQGLFNPAIGRLVELWGFHSDDLPAKPPDPEAITALIAQRPAMTDLDLDGQRLHATNPAVQLDFSAYAKGYAVDRAIDRFRELGVTNAIVNAGGDLRAIGHRGGRPWRIGIRHPRGSGVLASVEIEDDESVSTSGDYERFFMYNGRRYHHIMDPRTGYPATGSVAVTVLYREAATADAASTALFVAGSDLFEAVARDLGVDRAMLIDSAGKIYLTPSMRARVRFEIDVAGGIPMGPSP